jgi:hypothetical protein
VLYCVDMNSNRLTHLFTPQAWALFLGFLILLPASLNAETDLGDGWTRFDLTGTASPFEWTASSVLESGDPLSFSRYGAEKALDGDPGSSWVEGVPGPGIGESYILALRSYPEALGFLNGYAKNRSLFLKNFRVQELSVRIFAAVNVDGFATERAVFYDALPLTEAGTIHLSDSILSQRVELPFDRAEIRQVMERFKNSGEIAGWNFPQAREMGLSGSGGPPLNFRYIIRLEIADVYQGTTWDDTCIAELWPDYGEVSGVTESADGRSLLITTAAGEEVRSYSPLEYLLSIYETSPDNEWVLVMREPFYAGEGRVSTDYALIHTPSGRDMSGKVFDNPAALGLELIPDGFVMEGSRVFVKYEDLSSGKTLLAPCVPYGE